MTYSEIVSNISISLSKNRNGLNYYNYFIGITDKWDKQLYESHGINGDSDWHIAFQASSQEVAEDVVRYFVILGMNTNHSYNIVNKNQTIWVYCYEITMNSIE